MKLRWIMLTVFLQSAFAANFVNKHATPTAVNPYSIVGLGSQNLWVFSLTNPNTGGSGSSGGYPSNGSGNAMANPALTLTFNASQYATMLRASDYYIINYNVFTHITDYDSTGAATGPYVDTITFTITPTSTTYESLKGGTVTIGSPSGSLLPFTFVPNLSKIPTPTTYPNSSYPTGTAYKGVNMPGGEFSLAFLPSYTNAIYYAYKGMNTIRLPFSWENMQPDLGTPIDFSSGFAQQYSNFVTSLLTAVPTMNIILDMHNYMRYNGNVIGQAGSPVTAAQYASAWTSIANQFKSHSTVMFDIMNEPHDMATELILSNYNTAMAAIRGTGATNKILLEGNGYSCLGVWTSHSYGTPNSTVFVPANIVDPGNNYFISPHQYFTGTNVCGNQSVCGSGEVNCCVDANNVLNIESFSAFSNYLQTNSLKAFVGEVNAGTDPNCVACINNFLSAVEAASTANHASWGFIGWTVWSSVNINTTDVLSVAPAPDGSDRAQWTGAFNNYLLVPTWTP